MGPRFPSNSIKFRPTDKPLFPQKNMSGKDPLHTLIGTLNPSEKRYFKLYTDRQVKGVGNKYMHVFEVMENWEGGTVQELNTHIQGVTGTKQVSRLKNYLKQLILKSLVAYHAESNALTRIREHLSTVEVLIQKGLISECLQQLDKAEKLAKEQEAFLALLEINHWRMRLQLFKPHSGNLDPLLASIRAEANDIFTLWLNFRDYEASSISLYQVTLVQGHQAQENSTSDSIKSVLPPPKSTRAQLIAYRLEASGYLKNMDFKAAIEILRQQLELMEVHPAMLKERSHAYLSALRNMMILCRYAGEFNLARTYGEQLSLQASILIGKKYKHANINQHLANTNAQLDLFKDLGDLEKAQLLVNQMDPALNTFSQSILPLHLMAFRYLKGVCHFLCGEFREAIKAFYWISLAPEGKVRSDLQDFSRLLLMVSYFELSQLDTLETEWHSHRRYFSKNSPAYQLPGLVMELLKSLYRLSPQSKAARKAIRETCVKMETLAEEKQERKAFYYFNFLVWGRSQLNGRQMRDELHDNWW